MYELGSGGMGKDNDFALFRTGLLPGGFDNVVNDRENPLALRLNVATGIVIINYITEIIIAYTGEFTFGEYVYLTSEYLVLGYKGSPQYQDAPETFLYNFSSSGLASTAGKLELYYRDELIDEVC